MALFSKTMLLSFPRVSASIVASAFISMLAPAPDVDTLLITAPDPFRDRTLEALSSVIAPVLEKAPCPMKLKVEFWIENGAPE